jgi:RNA polymerase sigma-70 factor, ECF subfamily
VDEPLDELTVLALSARRGDPAAATAFVRATQADVWRLCLHLGSRSTVEDLTQETYARAFAALHRFAGRSAARTWLIAIARRVCADAVRAAVKTRDATTREPSPVAPDHAESVALTGLLDALDYERREAFVLTQLVGLSYTEAADACGCPVGTIRSRVARARADLVAAFGGGAAHRETG